MQYSREARQTLLSASQQARYLGHSYVGSMHLLLALLQQPCMAGGLLRGAGMELTVVRDMICVLWGKGSQVLPLPQGYSAGMRCILRQSAREAKLLGSRLVEPMHLLLALLRREGTRAQQLLKICQVDPQELFSRTAEFIHWGAGALPKPKKEGYSVKLLEQFSEDLIQKTANMEPVIGRDREIEAVIGILSRKNKNNPALVGEPGVGKTAIAEGLAQRMASGNVPPALKGKRLISLNMANMVAGTKYRGEFEERVRDVLAEIRRSGDIILFVDEMHTIVGAGAAEGAIDAANIFKPALGRGELQILGATTLEEYRKCIEKDPALERRFRPVRVEEPNFCATLAILRGLKPGLEAHHHMRITEEAMTEAVRMSVRYLPEQFLPDKAIDLLDEGAAHARMEEIYQGKQVVRQELEQQLHDAVQNSRYEEAAQLRDKMQKMAAKSAHARKPRMVTASDIAWAVSARTGIPAGRLTADRRQKLLQLEQLLQQSVIGQEEAIRQVSQGIRAGFCGLRDERRPVVSMLFTGPTGVGKTELCRSIARELYGTEEALLRYDMTEYMEKQSVARLIGAPPGYVGYEEGGKLTEAVRRRPYCLVLMDELEKAHPDVAGILLQIMEEGVLTDSTGRKVSFRNVILVMTCNVGAQLKGEGLGFRPAGKEENTQDALTQYFTPEFLGRLDATVCFAPLQQQAMEKIAGKFLSQLQERASGKGMHLTFPEELASVLGAEGNKRGGARQIRKLVQQKVEAPLAMYLLRCGKHPERIKSRLKDGELQFL